MEYITSASTFQEVGQAMSTGIGEILDLETNWNLLEMPPNTQELDSLNSLTFGAFGYDLTEFEEACSLSNYCDSEYYSEYFDGWAIGCRFYTVGDWDLQNKTQGFCT